jgi:hypothetical protein
VSWLFLVLSKQRALPVPSRVILKYPGSRCDVRAYTAPLTVVVTGIA